MGMKKRGGPLQRAVAVGEKRKEEKAKYVILVCWLVGPRVRWKQVRLGEKQIEVLEKRKRAATKKVPKSNAMENVCSTLDFVQVNQP